LTISMRPAHDTAVRGAVFDVRGRIVRRFDDHLAPAGPYAIAWDGRDDRGTAVPAGLYFVAGHAATQIEVGRIVVR